jgi:soluble lytic murein transglycosylase-like protein
LPQKRDNWGVNGFRIPPGLFHPLRVHAGILLLAGCVWLQQQHRLDAAFLHAANHHGIDWRLLRAVAMQESRMNPLARGKAGEIGMFQVMPITARHWAEVHKRAPPSEEELFRPRLNADIAAWYLRRGLDRFAHHKDPLPFALAYYNAGPSRVVAWEQQLPNDIDFRDFIPFPSTRIYVRSILASLEGG